jgi:hypothetical protein
MIDRHPKQVDIKPLVRSRPALPASSAPVASGKLENNEPIIWTLRQVKHRRVNPTRYEQFFAARYPACSMASRLRKSTRLAGAILLLFVRVPPSGPAFLLRKFTHPVTGKWGITDAQSVENFHGAWNVGPRGTLTEVHFGPQGREFLGDCDIDELIERRVFRFGNTAQFLQERRLKTKRKIALSHGFKPPKSRAPLAVVSHESRICARRVSNASR